MSNDKSYAAALKSDLSKAKTEFAIFTPDQAAEILASKTRFPLPQGKSTLGKIDTYARNMAANQWRLNGDAIIFDHQGLLVDGQARLRACVQSGASFATLVISNISDLAVRTLGSHLKRNTTDMLTVSGEDYARPLSAAWPIVVTYLNSDERFSYTQRNNMDIGASEVEQLNAAYPAMKESARIGIDSGANSVFGYGIGTAAHYLFSLADQELADKFFTIAGNPNSDPQSPPAVVARLISTSPKLTPTHRFAIVIKAWNRFRAGTEIKPIGLVFRGLGAGPKFISKGTKEAFPTIEGLPKDLRIDLKFTAASSSESLGTPESQVDAAQDREGGTELTVELMRITPQDAGLFLQSNGPLGGHGNRSIRIRHSESMARDMMDGRWMLNGQTLKFSRSGRLIDGQHRCKASVLSGKPFMSFVVRGLDDKAFMSYDTGDRHGLSGMLRKDGHENATAITAAIAMIHRIKNNANYRPTVSEGYDYFLQNPKLIESIKISEARQIRSVLPASVTASLHYLFSQLDPILAAEFFEQTAVGADLPVGHPVHSLRAILLDPKRRANFPMADQIGRLVIRAWNARREGKQLWRFPADRTTPAIV